MLQKLARFSILFISILIASYFIHTWIVDYFLDASINSIVGLSYIFNVIYTFLLVGIILALRHKFSDQIGFIFMAGSFIKIVFFIAITRWCDIEMSKSVFLDFFVPYAISMIIEVYYVAKLLKSNN